MVLDTVAWYQSKTDVTTLTAITALADAGHTVITNDVLVPPRANKIVAATGVITNASDTIAALQFQAPSLRAKTQLDVPVVNDLQGTASTTFSQAIYPQASYFVPPVPLIPGENLEAWVAGSGTTATSLNTVVAMLTDGDFSLPSPLPQIEHVRVTATQTATAHAWTLAAMTSANMTQTLRAGLYAILGMKAFSATNIATRFIFQDRAERPGCFGVTDTGHPGSSYFRDGALGVWGVFSHVNLPNIELLCNAADSAETMYWDLVKIG
jgi:hypothetical protein